MTESPDTEHHHRTDSPPQIVRPESTTNTITLPDVFHLGIQLEYLRTIADSDSSQEPEKKRVINVLEDINSTLANQDTSGVVLELVSKQQRKIGQLDSVGEKIRQEQAEELKRQATSWIHLFARNLANENRIPASESGILDMEVLINRPEELFANEVWEWLDNRPKEDIIEACRSVAVDCATASVMLSLRAVEHCLRKWYEEENESLDAAWGRVLDRLMEEYAEEENRNDTVLTQLSDLPPVLTNLYYLKEKRNEVNHPEESPSPREAQRTLLIVSSTITEIYEVMHDEAAEEAKEALEFQTGQNVTRSTLSSEEDRVLGVINALSEEYDDEGIPRDEIKENVEEYKVPSNKVDNVLQNLLMGGYIYEPAENRILRI